MKPSTSQFPRIRINGSATHGADLPNIAKCVRVGEGVGLNGCADPPSDGLRIGSYC